MTKKRIVRRVLSGVLICCMLLAIGGEVSAYAADSESGYTPVAPLAVGRWRPRGD